MGRRVVIYAGAILMAAVLQGTLVQSFQIEKLIHVEKARPDLILIVVVLGGLLAKTEGGMILGFAGGLVQGSLTGFSVPSFIISRLIPGFLAGLMETRLFRENLLVPPFAALVGTVIGELVFLLFHPPTEIMRQLQVISMEAVMNAILAPFIYLLLLKLLKLEH